MRRISGLRAATLILAGMAMTGAMTGAGAPALADGNADNLACFEQFKPGGDERLAIYYCSRAIQSGDLAPADKVTALLNRGVAHKKTGNLQMAIVDYTAALGIAPDDALVLANRANAYRESGKLVEALADISRALELQPERAASYYVRGSIYEAQGKEAEARADFLKAYELNPESSEYKDKAWDAGAQQ